MALDTVFCYPSFTAFSCIRWGAGLCSSCTAQLLCKSEAFVPAHAEPLHYENSKDIAEQFSTYGGVAHVLSPRWLAQLCRSTVGQQLALQLAQLPAEDPQGAWPLPINECQHLNTALHVKEHCLSAVCIVLVPFFKCCSCGVSTQR